jgi:hypothetical protein
MRLEVRRTLIPIGSVSDQWERVQYEACVWKYRDGIVQVFPFKIPDGYTPGLLTAYCAGSKRDLGVFVDLLQTVGLTLQDVESAINAPPAADAVDPRAADPGTPSPRV